MQLEDRTAWRIYRSWGGDLEAPGWINGDVGNTLFKDGDYDISTLPRIDAKPSSCAVATVSGDEVTIRNLPCVRRPSADPGDHVNKFVRAP